VSNSKSNYLDFVLNPTQYTNYAYATITHTSSTTLNFPFPFAPISFIKPHSTSAANYSPSMSLPKSSKPSKTASTSNQESHSSTLLNC